MASSNEKIGVEDQAQGDRSDHDIACFSYLCHSHMPQDMAKPERHFALPRLLSNTC